MKTEPSRTRKHGTRVTTSSTPEEKLAALRQIVAERQYAKIDGYMVDGLSANVIVKVYDALNDANKAKFSKLPIPTMARIAFELVA